MEGKSSYFILLVIVAFLSISLAFLAIGYFFFDKGSTPEKEVVVVTQKTPADDELSSKVIFDKMNFNLKKTNDKQIAVIVLSASMKHFKTVDGMSEKEITDKIDFYSSEIKSAIGTYFQGLTLDDVMKDDWKNKASDDLTKTINDLLLKNNDKKNASPLVYKIVFDYSFYQ